MFDFYHFWPGLNRLEDMDEIRPGEIQVEDPYEVALDIREKCEAVMSEAGVL